MGCGCKKNKTTTTTTTTSTVKTTNEVQTPQNINLSMVQSDTPTLTQNQQTIVDKIVDRLSSLE